MNHGEDIEAEARRAWAELVNTVLPAAALARGWPVATPAAFERVLLDHVLGAPWETVVAGPSAEAACALDLILALEVGERVREGSACLRELNGRSLALRAAPAGPRRAAPCGRRPTPDPDDPTLAPSGARKRRPVS